MATNDEMIDQEVQTDNPGSVSTGTQKPEDQDPEELLQKYIELVVSVGDSNIRSYPNFEETQ